MRTPEANFPLGLPLPTLGFWAGMPIAVREYIPLALPFAILTVIGGINVTESVRPPPELPVRPNLVYFELPSRDSDVYCKHVWQDRNIVVWLPPLLEQAQARIKLVGIFGAR